MDATDRQVIDNIFGKDFDEELADQSEPEPTEIAEQMLPLSVMQKMIEEMNLDLNVRTNAVSFAAQNTQFKTVDELLENAKKIEKYLNSGQ